MAFGYQCRIILTIIGLVVSGISVMLFVAKFRGENPSGIAATGTDLALKKLAQHGIVDYDNQVADFVFRSKVERVNTRSVLGDDGIVKAVFIRVFYKSGEIESYVYHLGSDDLRIVKARF